MAEQSDAPQLHINWQRPRAGLVQPIANNLRKPSGGLWTSTIAAERGSPWLSVYLSLASQTAAQRALHWRHSQRKQEPFHCWLLYPAATARVAIIDSHAALLHLGRLYGWDVKSWFAPQPPFYISLPTGPIASLNFERMAADFDAVQVTAQGVAETKDTEPYGLANEWSAEATVWLRWCFTRVVDGGLLTEWRDRMSGPVNSARVA